MKIIVTIPAYNEEETIGGVLDELLKVMNSMNYNYEVILLNDGSTDNTANIAIKKGITVFSNQVNLGLAETFKKEMKKCLEFGADIIIHIDADGQYNPNEIPNLINKINEGYDLVLASRFKGNIESMSFIKKIGNKIFSRTVSKITKLKISDAQTGFRAFTRKVAEDINIVSDYTYTQEQVIKAAKSGFKIAEVPANFYKRKAGKSKLMSGPFEYAIKANINLIRIYRDFQPLKFFGSIGLFLMIIGCLLGLYFAIPGIKANVGLLFLMLTCLTTGLQIILFGFLADKNVYK